MKKLEKHRHRRHQAQPPPSSTKAEPVVAENNVWFSNPTRRISRANLKERKDNMDDGEDEHKCKYS